MSGGGSSAKSTSSSRGFSYIDASQQAELNSLYRNASGLTQNQLGDGSQFQTGILDPAITAFTEGLQLQENPYLAGQIEAGQDQITQNLERNILPSIGGDAAGAGQRGGGRQGVAEGIAASDANLQASNFSQGLIAQDYQAQQARRLATLGQAGNISGLAFAPLQNLAQLLGAPTVLNKSKSESKSNAGSGYGGAGGQS